MIQLAITSIILLCTSAGSNESCLFPPMRNTNYFEAAEKPIKEKAAHHFESVVKRDTTGLMALTISCAVLKQQPGVKRTQLQRHDLSVSGREVIQSRIDFDPGVAFGNHSHLGEEIIYVIEGLFEYKVEGKPAVTLKAGDVLFIPAGVIHAAKNVGRVNAAELATYVVEKGKPLLVMEK